MSVFEYKSGIRLMISTANLIERDWTMKTQGLYLTPLLPLCESGGVAPDSKTNFRADLLSYLNSYGTAMPRDWIKTIEKCDFSPVKVHLIGSVPGSHRSTNLSTWGYPRLRHLLGANVRALDDVKQEGESIVFAQFSSIGSLGTKPDAWLNGQFLSALCKHYQQHRPATNGASTASVFTSALRLAPLKLIYPCVEDVRTSLEGYEGGGSLPYRMATSLKQPYLLNNMHKWRAERRCRTRAIPHIKCYGQLMPDQQGLRWFAVTSANLSKAAWGEMQLNGSQLTIRSYELGVLFVPDYENDEKQCLPMEGFLAFDWPLTKYDADDKIWVADGRYTKPDVFGNRVT